MASMEKDAADQARPSDLTEEDASSRAKENASGVPTEINTLKKLIDNHLRRNNVYAQIREFVREYSAKQGEPAAEKADPFDALKEKQIIQEIVKSLHVTASSAETTNIENQQPPVKFGLHINLLPGGSFVNEFVDRKDHSYVVVIELGGSRFRSRPVPCSKEPEFADSFVVDFSELKGSRNVAAFPSPMNIILLCKEPGIDGVVEVVASEKFEWRTLLAAASGGASVSLDLTGTNSASKARLAVGKLNLRLDIVPFGQNLRFAKDSISKGLEEESIKFLTAHRSFCQYAQIWWQEYLELNQKFKHRLVKIFAENEWGEFRAATTFVSPLRCGRALDSPQHAARFLSLLSYVRMDAIGGGRLEVWHSPLTFLSLGYGDCEDHATLLCSMLIGFGLRAYVCIGTVSDEEEQAEKPHAWVVTLGNNGKRESQIAFWESLTGQRISLSTVVNNSQYRKIGCLFNHEEFYANKQLDDSVVGCRFDVGNDLHWKCMDERLLRAMQRKTTFRLLPPATNQAEVSEALESSLRGLIAAFRASKL